jgi:hypothetical protein
MFTQSTNTTPDPVPYTYFWGMQVPKHQNSSHGDDHDEGSIETKEQPTAQMIVQITQIVLLIVVP